MPLSLGTRASRGTDRAAALLGEGGFMRHATSWGGQRHHRRRERACAFTLVELLVVIAVVALLIGLLMPVLAGVQDRGRDITCQSNLRGIMQAMFGYAAEHNGQLPWGYVNNRMRPGTWSPAPDSDEAEAVCWAALVARYWNRDVPPFVGHADAKAADVQRYFTPALQCPDAMQYRDHEVSYAMSMVV